MLVCLRQSRSQEITDSTKHPQSLIHFSGVPREQVYIVCECLNSRSLRDRRERGASIPPPPFSIH